MTKDLVGLLAAEAELIPGQLLLLLGLAASSLSAFLVRAWNHLFGISFRFMEYLIWSISWFIMPYSLAYWMRNCNHHQNLNICTLTFSSTSKAIFSVNKC